MNRREQIEAMFASDPEDTFLRYALAMEWAASDTPEVSLEWFEGLMNDSPPYVPAFFMAGQTLAGCGQIDQARDVLRRGIDQARSQGDLHAAAEMSEFLASLGHLGESG